MRAKLRLVLLGVAFLALITFTYFETRAFIASAFWIIQTGAMMALFIFAHNSLAATALLVGMWFVATSSEVIPARYRGRDDILLKHPRALATFFSVFLVLQSSVVWGVPFDVRAIAYCLPVASMEVYGVYLAVLTGLRGCTSLRGVASVYSVFMVGAAVETAIILLAVG